MFVTNLSEKLSERPKIECFEDGKSVDEPIPCPFTNEEILMRCVQTIQSQCIVQDESTNHGPKLVMIGTHQDRENKCSESRGQKNQRLRSTFCPDFEDQMLVYHGPLMKELIFPINAKTPHDRDHEVAREATAVILNTASNLELERPQSDGLNLSKTFKN